MNIPMEKWPSEDDMMKRSTALRATASASRSPSPPRTAGMHFRASSTGRNASSRGGASTAKLFHARTAQSQDLHRYLPPSPLSRPTHTDVHICPNDCVSLPPCAAPRVRLSNAYGTSHRSALSRPRPSILCGRRSPPRCVPNGNVCRTLSRCLPSVARRSAPQPAVAVRPRRVRCIPRCEAVGA